MKSFALLTICGFLALNSSCGCSNPFAPNTQPPKEIEPPAPPAPAATTPELLMDNLARAMRTRDEQLYESLLDKDFLFREWDCLGEVDFHYGLEQELEIMVGSRDGSQPGLFDEFRHHFSFDFTQTRREQELGSNHPEAFPEDPDGHPDEDWEVFYGRVQMELLRSAGEGFRVDQFMTFKLRLNPDGGLWKIIRWENDALSGACGGAGKPSANAFSWAALKQQVAP